MKRAINQSEGQLDFHALLQGVDSANHKRQWERECAHLPDSMEEGSAFYRAMLDDHHAAMMAADASEVMRLRDEARLLAKKLNKGEPGILASPDAPGNMLTAKTAAPKGGIPLWGQSGSFVLDISGTKTRIEMEGIFGIANHSHWLGFAIHAVHWDRPFFSETGYRSFLGVSIALEAGVTPDKFVTRILHAYRERDLGGRSVEITPRYRPENRGADA